MFFPSVLLVAHNVTEEGAWKKLSMLIVRGLKIVQHFDVPQRDTLNPVQVTPSPEYNTAKQGEARGINNLYIPPLWDENTTRRDTSVSRVKTIN